MSSRDRPRRAAEGFVRVDKKYFVDMPHGADKARRYTMMMAVRLKARKDRPGMSSSSMTTRHAPAGNGRPTTDRKNDLENAAVVARLALLSLRRGRRS